MSDDCERCGQPVASYEEVDAVLDTLTREDRARYRDVVAPLLREKFAGRCDGIATCVAVNWRERALAAERERDEAVARAERAEAECGEMRLLACAQREPTAAEVGMMAGMFKLEMARENGEELSTRVGTRRCARYALMRGAIPPSETEFRAALDEWRRTRQSKEPTP
jgi:hypothetical protein